PIRALGSCNEAARTHAPNETDRTPGMCSERTVSPFGRIVRRNCASAPMTPPIERLTRGAAGLPCRRHRRAAVHRLRPRAHAADVGVGLWHRVRPRQERLHRETQTSALVTIDELHLHAIALLDHVFGLLGALVAHL